MPCGCDCSDSFAGLLFSQLFDIGNSAGSLIVEALNIFRTFQRMSAIKSFTVKFSNNCFSMFDWAKKLIQIISNLIGLTPFTNLELFLFYSFAFPLSILVFVSTVIPNFHLYNHLSLFVVITFFGIGIGSIGGELSNVLIFTIAPAVIFIIYMVYYYCPVHCHKRVGNSMDTCCFYNTCDCCEISVNFWFSKPLFAGCFFFLIISAPISYYKGLLWIYLPAITTTIIIISFIREYVVYKCKDIDDEIEFERSAGNVILFLINFLNLFLIPSIENFGELIQGKYKTNWNIISSFVVNSLVLPIAITIIMVISNYYKIAIKYKEVDFGFNFYCLIELVDTVRQISYAIVAALDILWACIGIEIFWIILIIVVRPYRNISDYSLAFGNSLVLLISNGAALYCDMNDTASFSFGITLFFVILACIPAVVSIYLFFIFDFQVYFDDDEDVDLDEYEDFLIGIGLIASPICFFFLGIFLATIFRSTYE